MIERFFQKMQNGSSNPTLQRVLKTEGGTILNKNLSEIQKKKGNGGGGSWDVRNNLFFENFSKISFLFFFLL